MEQQLKQNNTQLPHCPSGKATASRATDLGFFRVIITDLTIIHTPVATLAHT